MLARASKMACNSTCSIFQKLGSISTICMLLIRLDALELAIFPLSLPYGSMKEPYAFVGVLV